MAIAMRAAVVSICCCVFLFTEHAFQDTSGLKEDLETIRRAFAATNKRLGVVTNTTESVGFWGKRSNGQRITQVDDKTTGAEYLLNLNAWGSHDFHLVKSHRREQVLPRGRTENSSVRTTAKSVSETLFQDGNMHMRFHLASVDIFRRVPKGWFDVETFRVGNVPPGASYLKAVDYRFILRQNALLDLSLLEERNVVEIRSVEDIPDFVTGRCFSINFTDSGLAMLPGLALGSNDFSGFEFSESFSNDLYRDASVSFRVCVTSGDAKEGPLVLLTETNRSGSEIPTRLAGENIKMMFLGLKQTVYDYVDEGEIVFPVVKNASMNSQMDLLVGWVVVAALLFWLEVFIP